MVSSSSFVDWSSSFVVSSSSFVDWSSSLVVSSSSIVDWSSSYATSSSRRDRSSSSWSRVCPVTSVYEMRGSEDLPLGDDRGDQDVEHSTLARSGAPFDVSQQDRPPLG